MWGKLERCICIQGCLCVANQHLLVCTAARQLAQNGLYQLWRWDKVLVWVKDFSLVVVNLTTQFQALSNWLTLECGSKVVLMVREELSAYYAPSPFFYSCRQKLAISQIHSEIILQEVTFCRIIGHISYLKIYRYFLMIAFRVMDFRVYHWGSL